MQTELYFITNKISVAMPSISQEYLKQFKITRNNQSTKK